MGLLFAYILKSSLYIIVFYLFYRLLLSRDTFYRFNRHALLIMLLMSVALPFFEYSHEISQATEGIGQISVELSAGAMAIIDDTQDNIPWLAWSILIYLTGTVFFTLRTVLSYISLAKVLRSGERKRLSEYGIEGHEDICLLAHNDRMSPFSWMNYIVINEEDLRNNSYPIVYHELGHIRHHHTLDLLFTELCLILQWFNPAIWLMRRELQTIHEYQADEEVLAKGINAHQYQLLLIEKATGTRLQSITCSLHQSSIKKRITMMLKKKSNPWARAKVLFAIPVAISGIALLSTPAASAITSEISGCKVSEIFADGQTSMQKNEEIEILINAESRILFNLDYATLEQIPTLLKQADSDANSTVHLVIDRDTPMSTVTAVKKYLREAGIRKLDYRSQNDAQPSLTSSHSPSASPVPQEQSSNDGNQVFIVCEQMPEFPGGEQEMMKFLSQNLKYPASCVKDSVQGRVFVSFVIEKDGSTGNIEIQKSVHPDLDAEALRVIKEMPNWAPGKQRGQNVRVKYIMPVTFRLR